MCGIAGIWMASDGTSAADAGAPLAELAGRMADALAHRGPDDRGVWADEAAGVALGHRRLSIVDLSPAGHQPMLSEDQRYVLSFNGEIYNFADLRRDLEATGEPPRWRGHSDTEVLLAAFVQWGVSRTLERAVGMFALALWDRRERRLALARDRFGEKPLYYGVSAGGVGHGPGGIASKVGDGIGPGTGIVSKADPVVSTSRVGTGVSGTAPFRLLFASELGAFRAVPGFSSEIDRDGVASLLQLSSIAAPTTIYRGVHQLPPGTWVEITAHDRDRGSLPAPRAYWSLREVIDAGKADPFRGTLDEAAEVLEGRVRAAVSRQMVADVPLGAFLSGGIDSSCIVALMQAQSSQPVRTFTIGFSEPAYDESARARAIAAHLGTDHTELIVTPEEALALIPNLPGIYGEPLADASQIPTILVSRLARAHVTVSLSGDAGDELFGGYNRYRWGTALTARIGRLPRAWRSGLGALFAAVPTGAYDRVAEVRAMFSGRGAAPGSAGRDLGDRAHKLAALLGYGSDADLYDRLFTQWSPQETGLPARRWPDPPRGAASLAERMMFWDATQFLPDDILVKVDRAAMSVGLETRVPLLDPEVAAFAWRLPLGHRLDGRVGKAVLRRVAYRHVPRELLEGPKMGFRIPLDQWLRGPLRGWAEDLLAADRLRRRGLVPAEPVRRAWDEHLSGRRNWQYKLWAVLMLEAWAERHGR